MFHSKSILPSIVALLMSASAGFLLGSENGKVVETSPTELDAGKIVGGHNIRLVGYFCGEEGYTVLLTEEDGFGHECKEIRRLDDREQF